MASRIAALEQRVEVLEQTLRLQALVIGRCLALAACSQTRPVLDAWLLELSRDMRRNEPWMPPSHPVMDALLLGTVTTLAPKVEELHANA